LLDGLAALRILVVDDNPQMRSIMATIINGAGVRKLDVASNGKRGLDLVIEMRPDIIYCDFEMPVMDGLDFVSSVRNLPDDLRFTPIIMLTGHGDMKRLTAARDRGVTEFVVKPVTVKTVLDRLQHVILFPRPFIQAGGYFGPERRRRKSPPGSPQRRSADHTTVI
jgi:CheY-like chemotaxis protein